MPHFGATGVFSFMSYTWTPDSQELRLDRPACSDLASLMLDAAELLGPRPSRLRRLQAEMRSGGDDAGVTGSPRLVFPFLREAGALPLFKMPSSPHALSTPPACRTSKAVRRSQAIAIGFLWEIPGTDFSHAYSLAGTKENLARL